MGRKGMKGILFVIIMLVWTLLVSACTAQTPEYEEKADTESGLHEITVYESPT